MSLLNTHLSQITHYLMYAINRNQQNDLVGKWVADFYRYDSTHHIVISSSNNKVLDIKNIQERLNTILEDASPDYNIYRISNLEETSIEKSDIVPSKFIAFSGVDMNEELDDWESGYHKCIMFNVHMLV